MHMIRSGVRVANIMGIQQMIQEKAFSHEFDKCYFAIDDSNANTVGNGLHIPR